MITITIESPTAAGKTRLGRGIADLIQSSFFLAGSPSFYGDEVILINDWTVDSVPSVSVRTKVLIITKTKN